MNTTEPKRSRGRPPAFDHEVALENALQAFWKHGYEGTSMAKLMDAMDLNKPSIYAAFGNKEELFRKVLEKYLSGPVSYFSEATQQPTARKVAEQLLKKSAEFLTEPENPQGCMIVLATLKCSEESEPVKQLLIAYRKGYEGALQQRFELAKSQSDLPEDSDPALLAKFVATLHQGLSVQATNGASKEELLNLIDMAMLSWPTN